jgi:hypothetical protein
VTMASAPGGCVIDVEEADDRSFSGSFLCRELAAGDAIVNVSGSFEASA